MQNIFKVNYKETRTTSGASMANFEYIYFTLYSTVNIAKFPQINASWAWDNKLQTINLFPVTVRNKLSYGLRKFVGLYLFSCLFTPKAAKVQISEQCFKKTSPTLHSVRR